MKTGHKIMALGCLSLVVGFAARWRWVIRMPLKEFTRYALYMAVMDDEICRNELEGNQIGDEVIAFPPKAATLQERYHLFLQMNRAKSRQQIQKEIAAMELRLQESQQYNRVNLIEQEKYSCLVQAKQFPGRVTLAQVQEYRRYPK